MSADILDFHVPPRKVEGKRRNVAWFYCYDPITRKWRYHIEVTLTPSIFSGEAESEASTVKTIENIMRGFTG